MRWLAILLAPFLMIAVMIRQLLPGKKTTDRTAQEVATYIRNFINGEGDEWDWDDFESVPITDSNLDRIRHEAALAGPPNPDLEKLADLLRRAEGHIKD